MLHICTANEKNSESEFYWAAWTGVNDTSVLHGGSNEMKRKNRCTIGKEGWGTPRRMRMHTHAQIAVAGFEDVVAGPP